MKFSPEARLLAGLVALKLDPALAPSLLRYLGELVVWNKAYNLTAVREPAELVTLLDSGGKKTRFLRNVQRVMALPNVEVVEARAEAWTPSQPFECIVSRAYGSLREFIETTAQLAAPQGRWLAMKGKRDAKELADLPAGYGVEREIPLKVPGLDEDRHLVEIIRR